MGRTVWPGLTAMVAALFTLCAYVFEDNIIAAGRYIPQSDILSDYLAGVVWASIIAISIPVWPLPPQDRRAMGAAWLAKCLVTLCFMLFYEQHYGLDSYSYFEYACMPDFPAETLRFGGGTRSVRFLAWLHNRVMPDSFHALKVSFSLVGLIAVYSIYRGCVLFLQREEPRLFLILALFPSTLFWSSTIGKDPIALFGIGIHFYGVVSYYRRRRASDLAVAIAGLLVAAAIRTWLALILAAPLALFAFSAIRSIPARAGWFLLTGGCFWIAWSRMSEQFHFETSREALNRAEQISQGWAQIQDSAGAGGVGLAMVPFGMFTALFRPLPGEIRNVFGSLAGLENVLLLGIFGFALVRTRWVEFRDPIVRWCAALVLSWATIYSFISTMNLGAAVRFKLQILPVLLALLLHLSRRRSRRQAIASEPVGISR